jgi:predicted nucleotidyltransferase
MEKHLNNCVMKLKEMFGERLIYVAAYGSQNYGLSYEGSDYDFKAIIVPSFDDIVFGRKILSTTIELEDGLCCIKDIRAMCSCWRKQNVNFIELLFTEYYYVNPIYTEEIRALRNNAEYIAHLDEAKALSCMVGMAKEKYAALFKPYPSQKEVVEKYGYAAKQLHHIHRLRALMSDYIEGKAYKDCLVSKREKASLVALKLYKPVLDLVQVKTDADVVIRLMEKMREDYVAAAVDEEAGLILDRAQRNIIRKALIFELKGQ